MNVGERIKELRRIKNLTLQDVSEKSGVSATAISAIERAVSSPTLETLGKIAAALEEPISVVIGEFEALYAAATTGQALRMGTLLPVNRQLLAAAENLLMDTEDAENYQRLQLAVTNAGGSWSPKRLEGKAV